MDTDPTRLLNAKGSRGVWYSQEVPPMSPIIFVVVLGIAGGVAMAAWMIWTSRRAGRPRVSTGPIVETHLSTDMINMAHIRVAGVGGLGLVFMSIITAIYLPSVGQALGL